MNDLIAALQIFAKYQQHKHPTCCEHDVFLVMDVKQDDPTLEEITQLDRLGFIWMSQYECWGSFRFGSA